MTRDIGRAPTRSPPPCCGLSLTQQFFVADYTLSIIMRAEMEKVNGVYQGASYPFRQGFATGLIEGTLTERVQIFIGGSKRGWPVRAPAERALQRLDWTGKVPFEVHSIRVKPDGFELRFTLPVDDVTARDPRSYTLETFTRHFLRCVRRPGNRASRPTHHIGHAKCRWAERPPGRGLAGARPHP